MADITRSSTASVDASTAMFADQISGLVTGEAIAAAGMPCYIKSDGKIWLANGTTLNAAATKVRGVSARAAAVGQPLTLFGNGCVLRLADSGLTPGADLFLSATSGTFADAATTGGTTKIAFARSASDVQIAGL